jgi:hypothetical protein
MAMATHPRAMRAAQEEIDRVVGTQRMPMFSDREDLPCMLSHRGFICVLVREHQLMCVRAGEKRHSYVDERSSSLASGCAGCRSSC